MPILVENEAAPLATSTDLTDYGTFAESAVLTAGEALRSAVGWHIAPVRTETLTIDAQGGTALMLPTLRLVDVTEVRDVSGDTPVVLTGWRKSAAGFLTRPGGWPAGPETIEVDIEHGYDSCPLELLPVLARRVRDGAATSAGQLRLGSLSVGTTSVGTTVTAQDEAVIRRYSL